MTSLVVVGGRRSKGGEGVFRGLGQIKSQIGRNHAQFELGKQVLIRKHIDLASPLIYF